MAEQLQKDPEDWVSGADPMTDAQASYLRTLKGWIEPDIFDSPGRWVGRSVFQCWRCRSEAVANQKSVV
ncbi:DUF3072 domain-containing protein [Bradyrhizobium oligotrophicum]|uniref:DUF3072 domain-containing protein n=1 Tax=Bradyrhizobium oligotrophicum TaxID=44255 RepID=UPI003EB6FC15